MELSETSFCLQVLLTSLLSVGLLYKEFQVHVINDTDFQNQYNCWVQLWEQLFDEQVKQNIFFSFQQKQVQNVTFLLHCNK